MASPRLGEVDSFIDGHLCILFLSRALIGLYPYGVASPSSSSCFTLALPWILCRNSLSRGPMPFPGCPLGQDCKCFQFGLIPGVSHSKCSCIFQFDALWPCSPPQCGNNSFCFANGTAGWLICAFQIFPADATDWSPPLTKVLHKHSQTWRPSLTEGERRPLLSFEKDS